MNSDYQHLSIEELYEIIEFRLLELVANRELDRTIADIDDEIKQHDAYLMRLDAQQGTTFRTAALTTHRLGVLRADQEGFRKGMGL